MGSFPRGTANPKKRRQLSRRRRPAGGRNAEEHGDRVAKQRGGGWRCSVPERQPRAPADSARPEIGAGTRPVSNGARSPLPGTWCLGERSGCFCCCGRFGLGRGRIFRAVACRCLLFSLEPVAQRLSFGASFRLPDGVGTCRNLRIPIASHLFLLSQIDTCDCNKAAL